MLRFTSAIMLIIFCVTLLVSCKSGENANASQATGVNLATSAAESEESKDAWEIATSIECAKHHKDYHIIPYNLVKHVGVDKCNEWAAEALKSTVTSAETTVCGCPDFNLKKFIDDMEISRETFIVYGDLVYYGTHDVDLLFNGTPEENDEYFIYSEELIDATIKSYHFTFIEKHFKYEYSSEVYSMTVYDNETGTGLLSSVPTMVKKLGIDRGAFEKILADCTTNIISIYDRSCNYEYDLSVIYNEDGSFKEHPELDGMSDYLREMKLNRMFCSLDE